VSATRKGHVSVERPFVGGVERNGEILETLGVPPHARYRVRWEDGHESILYPSSDAAIDVPSAREKPPANRAKTAPAARKAPRPIPQTMRAEAGDRLVILAHHQGEPQRDAEILEVLGADGSPPYRVRWDDTGHEATIFPGRDAFVEHFRAATRRVARSMKR
jgi:hypothetical protein